MVSFHSDDREDVYPEEITAHETEEGELALLGETATRWIVGEPMKVKP